MGEDDLSVWPPASHPSSVLRSPFRRSRFSDFFLPLRVGQG